jgi:hypothetical protein
MKKSLLVTVCIFLATSVFSQNDNCYKKLEDAFTKRGAYTVSDDMHKNVIISFFNSDGSTVCVTGKARVENGVLVSILLQYEDGLYEYYDKKFTNTKKTAPTITNGISEMAISADGEKFRVVFIDKLKPKAKSLKPATLPDDL